MTSEELTGIAKTSCDVLRQLGTEIQWVHSYVTGDKVYCVYIAPTEELIREHARLGKFPANRISEITSIIDISVDNQIKAVKRVLKAAKS